MLSLDEYSSLIAEVIGEHEKLSKHGISQMAAAWKKTLEGKFGSPILPLPNETVAIPDGRPKTCALFYDRIWELPRGKDPAPKEILVFGGSPEELSPVIWGFFRSEKIPDELLRKLTTPFKNRVRNFPDAQRYFGDVLFKNHGIKSVAVYNSNESLNREYKPGDDSLILAAISGLQLVDESNLTWEQVLDFRRDESAKKKFRRMRNWLNDGFKGRTVSEIGDAISARLEDYDWSIKKHGIQAVAGTVSDLLDPKVLTSAAATMGGLALAGGAFWAALGGAGIMAGKAAVSVTQKLVDIKDRKLGQGAEVAFVHELTKLTK